LASGWLASRLPEAYVAEASFECYCVRFDGAPATLTPPAVGAEPIRCDLLAAALMRLPNPPGGLTCDDVARRLSVRESRTHAGARRVVVRAAHRDPSAAQSVALSVAREYVESQIASDPVRRAILDLAQAEARLYQVDRLWEAALDRQAPIPDDSGRMLHASRLATVAPLAPAPPQRHPTLAEQTLQRCREKRLRIAEVYTDQHPAVVGLDRQIRRLEAELPSGSCLVQTAAHGGAYGGDAVWASATHAPAASSSSDSDPSLEELRRTRSAVLGELTAAQQKFEAVAADGCIVEYTDPAPGPEPIRYAGWRRARWFAAFVGATLAVVFSVELAFAAWGSSPWRFRGTFAPCLVRNGPLRPAPQSDPPRKTSRDRSAVVD
jgi:hypothetical protein